MHPTLLPPTKLSLCDKLASAGGVALVIVPDWSELTWQDAIATASGTRGYARFVLPVDSLAVPFVRVLAVARIDDPRADGTTVTAEFRITEIDSTAEGGVITVTCQPIIQDFGRAHMRSVVGGVPTKTVAFTQLTPTEILTDEMKPAIEDSGFVGLVIGVVEPTDRRSYEQRNITPLALGEWLEGETGDNLWLERVDDATWRLNLTVRGTDAPQPVAWVGRNVATMDHTTTIDDQFVTRVEPEGQVASGETEPTTGAQAQWNVTGVSGTGDRVVAIADPDGGPGPIGEDGQMDDAIAAYALDPVQLAPVPKYLGSVLAFDSSRRILWGYDQGNTLWYRALDDSVSGTVDLAAGATSIVGLAYDASVDRILALCGDVAKLVFVDANTKAVTTTVTLAGTDTGSLDPDASNKAPGACLSVVSALSLAFVGFPAALAISDVQVIDTSTEAISGVAATLSGATGARFVTYHAGTNKLFAIAVESSTGAYHIYNGTTLASVSSSTTGKHTVLAAHPDQTTIFAVVSDPFGVSSGERKWGTIDPSTGVFSGWTDLPTFADAGFALDRPKPELTPIDVVFTAGLYVLMNGHFACAFDPVTQLWIGTPADIATPLDGSTTAGQPRVNRSWAIEDGPTAAETSYLYVALGASMQDVLISGNVAEADDHASVCIARFAIPSVASGAPLAGLVRPFEAWFVQASVAGTTQTVTMPASGSGGPWRIDIGTRLEFRAAVDSSYLSYLTMLMSPSALATYNQQIDGAPQVTVLGKTNYWRGGTADEWRTDDTLKALSEQRVALPYPSTLGFTTNANRWRSSDNALRYATARQVVTVTADFNLANDGSDDTISLSGLESGQVLSPGDFIGGGAVSSFLGVYVRQRTVADGSGNATVPCSRDGLQWLTGTTAYLTSPAIALGGGRTDCAVLYPMFATTGKSWSIFEADVPVPALVSDAVAWAVVHFDIACYSIRPSDIRLRARAPYAQLFSDDVRLSDSLIVATGEVRTYWMAVRMDCAGPAGGLARVQLAVDATGAFAHVPSGALYVRSLQVVLAAASTEPNDLYGSEGPRAIHHVGTQRLNQGNVPTFQYKCTVVEDNPLKPFVPGALVDLRDPSRGIATKTPRLTAVTRFGSPPNTPLRAPEIEISTTPISQFSFLKSVLSGLSPTSTAAVAPSAPVTPSVPSGVGSALPVFVDPGTQTNLDLAFCDSMGDAGVSQSKNRWDFVAHDSYIVQRATSGFGGGSCFEEGSSGGFSENYWQYTDFRSSPPNRNDLHVTGRLNLNAQSRLVDVPLVQGYPTLCVLAMTPDRRLKILIDDGSGNPVTLGTSTSQLGTSGQAHLEFKARSAVDTSPIGYAWARVDGALVEFTPEGGGATVHGFDNLVFTNTSFTHHGQINDSIGTGTGSGFDYPWYAGNFPGPDNDYDTNGGIAGVQWDDLAVWDSGASGQYDFVGRVTFGASFVTTSGLSSDDGDTSYDELTAVSETRSYAIAAIDSGATDLVAIAPFGWTRKVHPSGAFTTAAFRWRVTSGASNAQRYFVATQTSYSNFMPDALYSTNTYTSPNKTNEMRWSVGQDPATSAAWTRSAVNAIALDLLVDSLGVATSDTIRISQMGIEYGWRP